MLFVFSLLTCIVSVKNDSADFTEPGIVLNLLFLLLKVMLLETSRRYNPETESITFLKDLSYNRDDFAKAGLQFEFINPIFGFSKGMNELQLNDAEYALLIAISIFSAGKMWEDVEGIDIHVCVSECGSLDLLNNQASYTHTHTHCYIPFSRILILVLKSCLCCAY
ncbi:ecdysone receptor-like [Sceloporus undulatus]|uniref:ecdysone receptor-like n=1 Tax=Sceloporus undulatus TaxID=8520 RepID=UPI001C4AC484|nr:ecdysone receptor-like [Sceloporus undulatus]